MERRLTTIFAADLAGYSRLMASDEEGVIERFFSARVSVIEPAINDSDGRIIKIMGDGLLAEFASPVAAVRSALRVQTEMAALEPDVPSDRKLRFRIGINLGDVVIDGDDILGDGVNIAARLESLASPGGICVSRTVHDQVRGKIDASLSSMGAQDVKNIPEPVEVWRVETGVAVPAQPITARVERPSIAVLPFENMASDADQDFLADGIVEDVITELSRFRSLTVIARNSTFAYKGTHKDVREIARDLDVRYVVEGSVRRSGERLRVTAQLVEAETGGHLWADRWDRTINDLFALQDELTSAIVGGVEPELGAHERDLAQRKATESLSAWEHYQRGLTYYLAMTEEAHGHARTLMEEAIAKDGQFASAYACLSRIDAVTIVFGWSKDSKQSLTNSLALARHAVALDQRSDDAYRSLGFALLLSGEYSDAIETLKTGIRLNPNNAALLCNLAQARLSIPAPDIASIESAIEETAQAIRRSPLDPLVWLFHLIGGFAFILRNSKGDDELAVEELRAASRSTNAPWPAYLSLAVALIRTDRPEEARAQISAALQKQPDLTLETSATTVPIPGFSTIVRQHSEALVALGLPLA